MKYFIFIVCLFIGINGYSRQPVQPTKVNVEQVDTTQKTKQVKNVQAKQLGRDNAKLTAALFFSVMAICFGLLIVNNT